MKRYYCSLIFCAAVLVGALLAKNVHAAGPNAFPSGGGVALVGGTVIGWASSTSDPSTSDTGLSRDAAGVVDFGTGGAASVAGSWKATSGTLTGTLTLTGATVAGQPTWSSSQTFPGATINNANTLALGTSTVSGTPTWSSNQAITLSTAAQPNVTSVGTLAGLTMTGTLAMSSTPVISGSPACTLGATTVTTLGTGGNVTLADGNNIVVNATTGTQIATATTQKLGFYGANPSAQIAGTVDALAWAVTLGFRAASSNPPLNLGSGAITGGSLACPTYTSAAAVAMTRTVGASSGTNTAGANLTDLVGLGTGTAADGDYVCQGGYPLATGTTVHTAYDRIRIPGATKSLSTVSGTTTTFALGSTISNSAVTYYVSIQIEVNDGTNWGVISAQTAYGGINKGGAVTVATPTNYSAVTVPSVFTGLAFATASVASGTNVAMQVTPSWAAGAPTVVRISYSVIALGPTVVSPQ